MILSYRMLLMAQPMQTALSGLAIMCGIVAFAYYAKAGCDPFKGGYISNLNQVSLIVYCLIRFGVAYMYSFVRRWIILFRKCFEIFNIDCNVFARCSCITPVNTKHFHDICVTFAWNLRNVGHTSKTLGRRCAIVIQMFRVYWGNIVFLSSY